MELADGSLYCALEDYEKCIRERRFKIAENEDRIASLKTSLANVQKENLELQLRRDKLKMETQVSDANYQAQSKKRSTLEETKASLDAKYAALTVKVERKKKTQEALKVFQASRLAHLQSIAKDYKERYQSIPSVKQLTALYEHGKFLSLEVSSKREEVDRMRNIVDKMNAEMKGNWNGFGQACLKFAEAKCEMQNLLRCSKDLSTKELSEETPRETPTLGSTTEIKMISDVVPHGRLNRNIRRGNTSSKSSGFHETLERLRNTRMKLTSLSNAEGLAKVPIKDKFRDGDGVSETQRHLDNRRNTSAPLPQDCGVKSVAETQQPSKPECPKLSDSDKFPSGLESNSESRPTETENVQIRNVEAVDRPVSNTLEIEVVLKPTTVDVFKIPAKPVAPTKSSSSSSRGTNGCGILNAPNSGVDKVPAFLSFEEEFSNTEKRNDKSVSKSTSGLLNIFGDSDGASSSGCEVTPSRFDFDNILFDSDTNDSRLQSFF